MSATFTFGVLTVSDTCHKEPSKDTAGPKLKEDIKKYFPNAKITETKIVPDEIEEIKCILKKWADNNQCNVILTTGGTGFSKRDVTPEATRQVIEKEAPGISFAMISKSLNITPMAMLSRAVCGIRSQSIIINLPGSQKGAVECFGFIKQSLPHAVAVLTDQKEQIVVVHNSVQQNGRGDTNEHKNQSSKVKLQVASRDRKSPYPMIEVSQATEIVFKECLPTDEIETIPFNKSINRVLAEDIYAPEPVPPFRASIKDGYAVRTEDGDGERVIKEVVAAGDKPFDDPLQKNEAIRISTGAAVPPGADAVVQVEDTSVIKASSDGTKEIVVKIEVAPKLNQDIRQIGSDVPKDSLVLKKHDQIQSFHIGVLAMLGKSMVKVYKQQKIGILSTGNEICHPNATPEPGQIRDANKFTLTNLLLKFGYDPRDCGVAKDNPDSVKEALEKAFQSSDVIITSGGVSMGEFDVLKQVLIQDFGANIHFARVNMKPGKPTTFATLHYQQKRKIFFGLPGNPVSCGVTCLLYVIPALRYMERNKIYNFPIVRAKALDLKNTDPRPEYHRVQVTISAKTGEIVASSTGNQISSRLNSLVNANGLALVQKNEDKIEYKVILFDSLFGVN